MSLLLMAMTLSAQVEAQECVVVLHGLARTDKAMQKLADRLDSQGYQVVNYGYPSQEFDIPTLADKHIPEAILRCKDTEPVHFVTHSLGGILVRQFLSKNRFDKLGRVVMLGPPNKGSQVVDHLRDVPGFEWFNGPAGMQLGTGANSIPNQLGPANFEVGIIAGSKSFNLILSNFLPNPDDGKVSVENTKLDGMTDHITLPVTHTFMMRNNEVIAQVIHFLDFGTFQRDDQPLI